MPAGERNNSLPPRWDKENVLLMIPNRPGPSEAYRYFNPNVFPEHVEVFLRAAEDHWGVVLASGLLLDHQLAIDTRRFVSALKQHIAGGPGWIPRGWTVIGVSQSAAWRALFYGFLMSLRSMLDVMGSVWARVADPGTSCRGFHKGRISADQVSGGKLINWLRQSCPAQFMAASAAADTIERNSREWITEAVAYRDAIVHKGDISGLTPLAVPLELEFAASFARRGHLRQVYAENEIVTPKLPNGLGVYEYCRLTIERAERFLLDMLKLFAAKESRVPPGPPDPGDRMYISEELLKPSRADSKPVP